MNINKYILL